MASDTQEGSAYLRALRQIASEAAVDVRPEPSRAAGQTGEQHPGAEKRRCPRYKCVGSVQMREQGCDVHTWSGFTDVSLDGCYVESQATYPVGTILEMKLEANGTRVETRGNVRVNYPYLGMGIAFVDMSEENQAHLRQLIASLSRRGVSKPAETELASSEPILVAPLITNPAAALQSLVEFFQGRQMLMREEFVRILKKSQK